MTDEEKAARARTCTVCNAKGDRHKPASFVARAADGLEWFECDAHDATDNVAEVQRVRLTPLDEWFDAMEAQLTAEGFTAVSPSSHAQMAAFLFGRN